MFQPDPVLGGRGDQRLPAPVDRDLLWQQQIEQRHQTDPQRGFQVHANQRQPPRGAGIALQQHLHALLTRLAAQAFELHHRQQETAAHAQASPGQAGQQLRLEQPWPLAKGLFQCGSLAKHGFGQNVQRQAFEGRFQPPENEHGKGWRLPQQSAQQGKNRQSDDCPTGHQQASMALAQQDAEVHGFPGRAWADHHAGVTQAHGGPVRQTADNPRPTPRAPRRPGIWSWALVLSSTTSRPR
ncbi:hypothetical protein D3C84_580010 [compost metagenome]